MPVTGITTSQATATIKLGTTKQVTATVTPDNATDKKVVWTTADANIATVDATGLITPVAEGSTKVTATSGTASADVVVTVTPAT